MGWWRAIARWFDSGADAARDRAARGDAMRDDRVDWLRVLPFIGMHLACLGVIWVGISPVAVGVAVGGYLLRMFAITGFYHRYFSHRTFQTSRLVQFLGGALGAASVQRGPLWWAAHHRLHHRYADTDQDPHSPRVSGFVRSHLSWFLNRTNFATRMDQVPDLARYPELRFLDRFDLVVPVLYAAACFGLGVALEAWWPTLGTSGPQMLVWGFFVSTVVLYHATFTINSLAHVWGSRRYDTDDDSRNNWFLSVLTLGEGWHNNHHHHPGTARQGFRWWEFDPTWYVLKALEALRIVRDVRGVPARVVAAGRRKRRDGADPSGSRSAKTRGEETV